MSSEAQRAELHRTIWKIANDLRGSIDGWDFKTYVLGMLFYRFISENLSAYLDEHQHRAGEKDFRYASLTADKEIKASISRAVDSSLSLRSKKDLIERFIARVNVQDGVDVDEAWRQFVSEQRSQELEQIIEDERLEGAATRVFMDQAFRSGAIQTAGTGLARVMPATNIFSHGGEHELQRSRVLAKLQDFFNRFSST